MNLTDTNLAWFNGVSEGSAVLSNGMMINLGTYDKGCDVYGLGAGHCAYIQVDINGLQGPNLAGRDVFMFMLMNKKYYSIWHRRWCYI